MDVILFQRKSFIISQYTAENNENLSVKWNNVNKINTRHTHTLWHTISYMIFSLECVRRLMAMSSQLRRFPPHRMPCSTPYLSNEIQVNRVCLHHDWLKELFPSNYSQLFIFIVCTLKSCNEFPNASPYARGVLFAPNIQYFGNFLKCSWIYFSNLLKSSKQQQ